MSRDVQEALRIVAGLEIGDDDAAALVPLVRAQEETIRGLRGFDVTGVVPATTFDPAAPFAHGDER